MDEHSSPGSIPVKELHAEAAAEQSGHSNRTAEWLRFRDWGWAVRLVQGFLLAWLLLSFVVQINMGLADNGDYSRFMLTITSGPIGMENWPPAGTQAYQERFFNYWLPYWHLNWPWQRSPTTIMLLWVPGALLNAAVYSRDILWLPILGLPIKIALLALVALLFMWIERRAPRHRLLLTVVLAGPLVLSLSTTDFVVLINSFYRESGSLVYLLVFFGSLLYLNARRSALSWWLCLAAALLMTFARASNIYWPFVWVPVLMWRLPLGIAWRSLLGRSAAGAALVGLLVFGSQRLLADYTNAVTSYDNLFNSSLLVSQHPADHLARLGMPEALPCVGVSPFFGIGPACFARYVSRMRPRNTLSVMLWEPMVLVYQFQLGINNLGDESIEYLGIYAQSDPRAELVPAIGEPALRFRGVRSNVPLNFWSWLRYYLFPHGWLALAALALFAGLAVVAFRRGGPSQDLALVSLIAIVACLLDIQVQVVGEGIQDLIRHLLLANMLFDVAGIAAVGSVLCTFSARRQRGSQARMPAGTGIGRVNNVVRPTVRCAAVVVPTYNEAENIRRLVPELLALPDHVSVIVVDDASPDGTGALADSFAQDAPNRVSAIHRAAKMGLGTAYLAGFRAAIEGGADCVITMDADFSHHPKHIPAILAQLTDADLVIGSRYVPGGAAVDSPAARRLLSWGANRVSRTALGLQARDVTAGFRAYRRDLLTSLPLDHIFSSGYSFLIETLYHIERGGWRVAEVPIQFYDRTSGTSKISRREIAKAMYTVMRLACRRLIAPLRAAPPRPADH